MSIKPFNEHYSFNNPASVHDEEALTSLELAGRTTAKVNEVVRDQNALREETETHLEQQDNTIEQRMTTQDNRITKMNNETMPAKVTAEVQEQIEDGTFDRAIDMYAGNLESRLDSLLGSVTEGSTTMDAEIIDARGGLSNLGTRLSRAMEYKETVTPDADVLLDTGFYVVSSAHTWSNLPDGTSGAGLLEIYRRGDNVFCYQFFTDYLSHSRFTRYYNGITFTEWEEDFSVRKREWNSTNLNEMTETGVYFTSSAKEYSNLPPSAESGVLLVFDGGTAYTKYQLFIRYMDGEMYERNMMTPEKGFSEWRLVSSWGNRYVLPACDLDTVNTDGYYYLGGSVTYTNLPFGDRAGLLHVFCDKESSSTRFFQIMYGYEGRVYFRNYRADLGKFNEWKQLLTSNDVNVTPSTSGDSKEYIIVKENDTSVFIYKKGSRGYIRYRYMRQVDESINLDIWRLATVSICDASMTALKDISTSGADLEGVVLLSGNSDHVGGVHGDEQLIDYYLFIDGKPYTFDTVETMECDEVRIIVNSNITNQDSTDVCFEKNKQTTFDRDGVHVRCTWKAMDEVTINSIRACMMSVNKDCITHYYDSNINRTPLAVPEKSSESVILSSDANMTDVFYMGDATIHHWAGFRGGEASGYSTILQDYGYRLKSYFNCYDGHTTTVGEELVAENHFYISC